MESSDNTVSSPDYLHFVNVATDHVSLRIRSDIITF